MERVPSSSSSDDDEDRRTLVPQNETKPPRRLCALEVGSDLAARIGRAASSSSSSSSGGSGFWYSKRYLLLAICLPLVLILVFFSLDLGRLFRRVSIIPVGGIPAGGGGGADRMREAELRALYLLRNQQFELRNLWNRTLLSARSPSYTPYNSSVSVPLEKFRLAMLKQIKLNREIQEALLSSHRFENTRLDPLNNNVGFDPSVLEFNVCQKVDKPAERRTIEWKPKKDRYLLAICLSGQMSNHLICLEKHMFFAALLDRVLILPSHVVDYQYERVLDIDHINRCFGRNIVVSFEEFRKMSKKKVHVDEFICYMASPPCFLDEEHIKRLKSLGISLGKIEAAWSEDAKLKEQEKRVADDIRSKFSSDVEVLAVGDLFYADVEEEWVMQPGGPLSHKCNTVIQPSRLIMLTAQRFVQTFLGSKFIALHFRRHGFLKFW
ncbi:hypothetical protein ACMD2_25717 [Ananas comosus]|uniref:O-fucosyltransferase family protein n=1 Tax=Ananas comosus TaxID=4615 RepID=A0A199VQT1_ANACO|nr:hypothetical protein ACMD2_25717 [Ananas comosus]